MKIPDGTRVTFRSVRVPVETPIGTIENVTMQLEFDGKSFQVVDMDTDQWMDIETGELVDIKLP